MRRVSCESTLSPGGSVSKEREKRKPENHKSGERLECAVVAATAIAVPHPEYREIYSEQVLGRDLRPIPWNDYQDGRIAEYSRVRAIPVVDVVT